MKRRSFLRNAAALGVPLVVGGSAVQALAAPLRYAAFNGATDRVLVLIELSGGNDGLNTVLPFDKYDQLQAVRGNLLIDQSAAISLSTETGLHPALAGMQQLWDNAQLQIVQGVGYPNQNRSHFRSIDIWNSGSAAEDFVSEGWLGRWLSLEHASFPDGYPNAEHPDPFAIRLGRSAHPSCQGYGSNFSIAVQDPTDLGGLSSGGNSTVPDTPYGEELTWLRQTIAQTNAYGSRVGEAAEAGSNAIDYPISGLAEQLATVARLISGGIQTKIFVCSLGGFDTHAGQLIESNTTTGIHAQLLRELGDAVAAFQNDLNAQSLQERVIGMTFSEFGRRIKANDSQGTDHGSAAPLFMFGSCLAPGFVGTNPELPEVIGDADGVALQFDFRDIYGSILEDWFETPADDVRQILHQDYQKLPIVQVCSATNTNAPAVSVPTLRVSPSPFVRTFELQFDHAGGYADLALYDARGAHIAQLHRGELPGGSQTFRFTKGHRLPAGNYFVRLQVVGGVIATEVVVKL